MLYGGARCVVPELCKKEAILDLFHLMAEATAVTTVFPAAGLLGFLLSPKTQIKLRFTLKMPVCCLTLLLLPCGRILS